MSQSVPSLLGLFKDLQIKISRRYWHISVYCRLSTVAHIWNQPKRLSSGEIE